MSKVRAPVGYVAPNASVDSIVFQLIDNELAVLLIKREKEPFKDMWALPGGYNPAGERTYEAMSRVLNAKAGVDKKQLGLVEQLYTFDSVARDPRGHALTITYMGLGRSLTPKASKTTQHPQFFAINHLPELAFDHANIIKYAHNRLASKITYTNAVCALLPPLFTLTQLQSAYEAILGHSLDKRNFRKKFLSLDLVKATSEYYMDGAHRPARLYKFKTSGLEVLARSFD